MKQNISKIDESHETDHSLGDQSGVKKTWTLVDPW